jgi:hypothetical protein
MSREASLKKLRGIYTAIFWSWKDRSERRNIIVYKFESSLKKQLQCLLIGKILPIRLEAPVDMYRSDNVFVDAAFHSIDGDGPLLMLSQKSILATLLSSLSPFFLNYFQSRPAEDGDTCFIEENSRLYPGFRIIFEQIAHTKHRDSFHLPLSGLSFTTIALIRYAASQLGMVDLESEALDRLETMSFTTGDIGPLLSAFPPNNEPTQNDISMQILARNLARLELVARARGQRFTMIDHLRCFGSDRLRSLVHREIALLMLQGYDNEPDVPYACGPAVVLNKSRDDDPPPSPGLGTFSSTKAQYGSDSDPDDYCTAPTTPYHTAPSSPRIRRASVSLSSPRLRARDTPIDDIQAAIAKMMLEDTTPCLPTPPTHRRRSSVSFARPPVQADHRVRYSPRPAVHYSPRTPVKKSTKSPAKPTTHATKPDDHGKQIRKKRARSDLRRAYGQRRGSYEVRREVNSRRRRRRSTETVIDLPSGVLCCIM